jgi:adenylate kinase
MHYPFKIKKLDALVRTSLLSQVVKLEQNKQSAWQSKCSKIVNNNRMKLLKHSLSTHTTIESSAPALDTHPNHVPNSINLDICLAYMH